MKFVISHQAASGIRQLRPFSSSRRPDFSSPRFSRWQANALASFARTIIVVVVVAYFLPSWTTGLQLFPKPLQQPGLSTTTRRKRKRLERRPLRPVFAGFPPLLRSRAELGLIGYAFASRSSLVWKFLTPQNCPGTGI